MCGKDAEKGLKPLMFNALGVIRFPIYNAMRYHSRLLLTALCFASQ